MPRKESRTRATLFEDAPPDLPDSGSARRRPEPREEKAYRIPYPVIWQAKADLQKAFEANASEDDELTRVMQCVLCNLTRKDRLILCRTMLQMLANQGGSPPNSGHSSARSASGPTTTTRG